MSGRATIVGLFVSALAACEPALAPKIPIIQRHEEISIHVDPAFSPDERWAISAAGHYLTSELGITYRIDYDLALGNVSGSRWPGVPTIRLPGESSITWWLDHRYDGVVYGATVTGLDGITRVYLIADRFSSELIFLHVVEHELLHVAGLDHVTDPKAVMFGFTNERFHAVELTDADRSEFNRGR